MVGSGKTKNSESSNGNGRKMVADTVVSQNSTATKNSEKSESVTQVQKKSDMVVRNPESNSIKSD